MGPGVAKGQGSCHVTLRWLLGEVARKEPDCYVICLIHIRPLRCHLSLHQSQPDVGVMPLNLQNCGLHKKLPSAKYFITVL